MTAATPAGGRRIGIDATFIRHGAVGGAEPMLINLVSGLGAVCGPQDSVWVFGDASQGTQGGPRVRWIEVGGEGNRFVRGWRAVARHAGDLDAVLFPNYFTPPLVGPPLGRRPRVVTTIHDLQYLHFPQNFSGRKRAWLRLAHEATLRLADRVVVISDWVREDLLARYGRRWESKVLAIPNPISWARFDAPGGEEAWAALAARVGAPQRPYVLSVAAQWLHKNLDTLVRAYAELKRDNRTNGAALVLVGQTGKGLVSMSRVIDLPALIAELGLERDVFVTGFVSDPVLGRLYKGASAFVMPSLFEGFGMPPVEALGFGLPTLSTRATALPEATLGLATYLDDPLSAREMAAKLADMLADPAAYTPTRSSVERVRAHYTPERIAGEYYRVLVGQA